MSEHPFKEGQKNRLLKRTQRLLEFIKVGAPKPVIGAEIHLVLQAGVAYCNPEDSPLYFLAEDMRKRTLQDHGYCIACEDKNNPRSVVKGDIFCLQCQIDVEKIEAGEE